MIKLLLFILLLATTAKANSWDEIRFKGLTPGKSYSIIIGSGFFVNNDMIVTNRHVVDKCLNIAIRGAVPPTLVQLYLIDKELDLALLKSPYPPKGVPYLRNNHKEVKIDDVLFSIGYPLEHGDSGEYIIKEAKVINIRKYSDLNFTHIEFTDNINNGNSGGPLLDKNSNLVGVVTAKLTYKSSIIQDKEVAMAIGVEGLMEFLKRTGVFYASSSTYDIFTNYHVDRLVRNYVVNIHCILDVQNKL